MQDRTPTIAEPGHHRRPYTGNYASLMLRAIRIAGSRGMSVADLMGSMGVTSRHDETFPAFREALDHLWDMGLIGCQELEALPEEERVLDMNQVWGIK